LQKLDELELVFLSGEVCEHIQGMTAITENLQSVWPGFTEMHKDDDDPCYSGLTDLEHFKARIRKAEVFIRLEASEMFTKCDKDKDGALSIAEYFAYRANQKHQVLTGKQRALIRKEFDQIDTDKSGALDFDELVHFMMQVEKLEYSKHS
jgi:hypothetical protein